MNTRPVANPATASPPPTKRGHDGKRFRSGEERVRSSFNIGDTTRIIVNNRLRFPDGLTRFKISEVKNVRSLGFTLQLRDYADFARDNGLTFDLYVRPGTELSGPLEGRPPVSFSTYTTTTLALRS